MVHATCAALHCNSSSHTDKDLKFHQFPRHAERRKIWLTACKRSDWIYKDWDFFKYKYVCSLHFQKCMYGKKACLRKYAIPSHSTQTVQSMQHVNQRYENDLSISNVMPNVESNSTTTYTQMKHVNKIEEIITPTNIEESESVEQDVEIKTENDDENSDSVPRVHILLEEIEMKTENNDNDDENSASVSRVPILFEEDIEMKTEIVESKILPLVQSTQSLQSNDLEIIKDGGTLSTQVRNPVQDIGQGFSAAIVNRTVKRQMHLDEVTKQGGNKLCEAGSSGSLKAGAAKCVELNAVGCGGVVLPDVVIAGTETADSTEADLYAVDRVEAIAAASTADCARRLQIHNILELSEDQGLETHLHPKRMRKWPPLDWPPAPRAQTAASPPPPPSSPTPSTAALPSPSCSVLSPAAFEEYIMSASPSPSPSPAPPVPASASAPSTTAPPSPSPSVPSPEAFEDCESASSPGFRPPSPPRRPRQPLRDEQVSRKLNYGSDAGSDESDDEDVVLYPPIPRVFRSVMQTPLDIDDDDDAQAADPAPFTDGDGVGAAPDVPLTATDQPWRWFQFDWREFPNSPIPHESRRETFSQSNVGPTTPRDDPYDNFVDIWDRQIMEYIASETNRYAQQVATQLLASHSLHPNSRISQWQDTTADELYLYFGMILAMGIVVKSRMEEYWGATPDIFYTPGFSAHMSLNRFQLLNKCLHFNNNEDMGALELDSSEARLFKINPILSHLNSKFQALYTPAQNIVLDESLLMWKGWLEIGQINPNKAANKGIKTYEVCESQTGYLWRIEVHAHKKNRSQPQQYQDPLEAFTPSIILRLIQGLEHKGYTLWMDNFYNSPCLARRLKSLGFDCVGTLRTDRQFVPQALHSLTKRCMTKGQVAGLTSGDVDVMVWRDNNRVAMISTYHGIGPSTQGESTKPILILDYNIMMGGVDKKDQLLAMYPVERKRTRVWYKKLFRRLLNISVLNSYIIHRHTSSSSLPHRNFRIKLIKSLLSKHNLSPTGTVSSLPVTITSQIGAIDVTHRLKMLPMGRGQIKRRTCVKCKKQCKWICAGCDKVSCLEECFVFVHSNPHLFIK